MMKSLIYILLSILIACASYTWYLFSKQNKTLYGVQKELALCQQKAKTEAYNSQAMKSVINAAIKNNGTYIDLFNIILAQKQNMDFAVTDDMNTFLIVRLSQNHCQPCINILMSKLQNYKHLKNILFITDYESPAFIESLSVYRIQHPYLKVNKIPLPADELETPYLFIWNERTKQVNSFFLVTSALINELDKYLSHFSSNFHN